MNQGILFDYSSVFPIAAGTTLACVREIATNHGVAEGDLLIVCASDQTLLNVWPTAKRLTITSLPKTTLIQSLIEQIAREGKLSSLILLSYDNDVLRAAQGLAFDGLTIVPRHLKAVISRTQTIAHPQSTLLWRFDSIATLDEAVSDLVQTLTRASAMSEGTGLSLTEIRPLMKGVNRRWAGKSSLDGTVGMIRDLLAVAKQRGLIADARNATSVHPLIWLTLAGKQLAENAAAAVVSINAESGAGTAATMPAATGISAQTEPPAVNKVALASPTLEVAAKQTRKRP